MKSSKKMKFNFNLALIFVAGSLSLCHLIKDDIKLEGLEQAIESLQNENDELKKQNNILQSELDEMDETCKLLLDEIVCFFDEQNCGFFYQENVNGFVIYGQSEDGQFVDGIPEEIYCKINQFSALNSNIRALSLHNIFGNIDFSKLDLSNVEYIDLSRVGKNVNFSGANLDCLNTVYLDCIEEGFDYSAFENENYDLIHFEDENEFNKAIGILENSTINGISLRTDGSYNDEKQMFDYLNSYTKKIKSVKIISHGDNYEEILELVSKLNAHSVYVALTAPEDFSHESKIIQPLSINLELNPNINKFDIYLFSASLYGCFEVNEINITSSNKNVEVIVDSTYRSYINENAEINVPNFNKFSMMLFEKTTIPYQKKQ